MSWTKPDDLPEDWVDNIGMVEDAEFLNKVGGSVNACASGIDAVVNGTKQATVATSESTSSGSYTDLATTTDSVTVTIGDSGLAVVLLGATLSNSAVQASFMGFAASGANTIAASDAQAISFVSAGSNYAGSYGTWFILTGLTPGSTTFKAKYRSGTASGTATFSNRRIAALPFP